MANFAKSGHTETSFWERNFFWWNLNDCIFPIKIAAEILKMKIRETFNFQKTRNQNLKYAPNWNPFWGHHLEGLKSFFFSSASAKSMHKVLMSFRVLICSLSLSLSLSNSLSHRGPLYKKEFTIVNSGNTMNGDVSVHWYCISNWSRLYMYNEHSLNGKTM